jgi:hypothetical protein
MTFPVENAIGTGRGHHGLRGESEAEKGPAFCATEGFCLVVLYNIRPSHIRLIKCRSLADSPTQNWGLPHLRENLKC